MEIGNDHWATMVIHGNENHWMNGESHQSQNDVITSGTSDGGTDHCFWNNRFQFSDSLTIHKLDKTMRLKPKQQHWIVSIFHLFVAYSSSFAESMFVFVLQVHQIPMASKSKWWTMFELIVVCLVGSQATKPRRKTGSTNVDSVVGSCCSSFCFIVTANSMQLLSNLWDDADLNQCID